ncbi:hypothetical protein ES707_18557 [subsurface metagenome]
MVWKNRTQDEIDETIEKIADWVIRNDMEDPAILFFESIKPVAGIGARIGGAMFAGLIPLIGWGVDDRFVALREGKDVEKVIQLIEKASEAKHTAREEQKKQSKNRKRRRRKLLPDPKPKEAPKKPPKEDTPQKKPWYWPF